MVYKRFNIGIIILAILMGMVSYTFAWSLYREYQLVTSVSLLLVFISLVIAMIWHVSRTNRELARFLMALQFDDTSNLFDTDSTRGSQKKLFESFNKIILDFQEQKIRKQREQSLLDSTFEQTGAGILVLDPEENVELCNTAFLDMLGIKTFKNLSELMERHPEKFDPLRQILPGKQDLLEVRIRNPKSFDPEDRRQIILNAREIVLEKRRLKVITIQNIQQEIEQSENMAWEKLLRIINHEILNSVSPINLLSTSVIEMLEENNQALAPENLDADKMGNILLALKTIRKRGKGLIDFVESYRAISRIPEPVLKDIHANDFFREIEALLKPELDSLEIKVSLEVNPPNLEFRADESLFQQTMINLLRNAMLALEGRPKPLITIMALVKEGRPVISVVDNGVGMDEELLDKVFTPFYTSHKDGSGVGLSFARQVMMMHHGKIVADSSAGKGSVFSLYF